MLELAKSRLGECSKQVEWVVSDFKTMPSSVLKPGRFDVVISSYALHHLDASEKLAVLKAVVPSISPGGWFLNADLIIAETAEMEQRIQEIRVEAVTGRAPENDKRFRDIEVTRKFLDDLEAAEQDQPQTLDKDLQIIRESGITTAEVLWKEYREVVIGGLLSGV